MSLPGTAQDLDPAVPGPPEDLKKLAAAKRDNRIQTEVCLTASKKQLEVRRSCFERCELRAGRPQHQRQRVRGLLLETRAAQRHL